MPDLRDLDVIGEGSGAGPAGDPERSRSRRPVLFRWWFVAGAAVVMAGTGVVVMSSGGSAPSAADTLAGIRRFVAGASSVRYTFEQDNRFARAHIEGVVRFPDRTTATLRDDPYPWENITIGDAVYDRSAEEGEDLAAQQWVYTDASDLQGPPGADTDFGGLVERAGVPPLRDRPGRANLAGVLGALERLERVDGDTVRGTLPLGGLFTDPKLAEIMLDGTGSVTVTLTSGPRGRLDRIVWHLKARRLTADSCDDGSFRFRSCFEERTVLRFSHWNDPVEITAPPLSQIDLTPGVDEDAVATIPASVRVAPRRLPADLLLTNLSSPRVEGDLPDCAHTRLTYQSEVAGGSSGSPRMLYVEVDDLACVSPYDTKPVRRWQQGRTRGDVLREGTDDAAISWLVVVRHGPSRVTLEGNLTEAELATVIDSLGPLDLAAQPVYRSVPPQH